MQYIKNIRNCVIVHVCLSLIDHEKDIYQYIIISYKKLVYYTIMHEELISISILTRQEKI
jgi:hypothetical protein